MASVSDMEVEFENALGKLIATGDELADQDERDPAVSLLISQVATYRARAAYWEGTAKALQETVAVLKAQLLNQGE